MIPTQLISNLTSALKNKHVSIPLVLAAGCEVGKIWLPTHATQFEATQKVFAYYAVMAAANSAGQPIAPGTQNVTIPTDSPTGPTRSVQTQTQTQQKPDDK